MLVFIELVQGRPVPCALRALAEGRRVGTLLGATVYAVAPCKEPPQYGDDDLIAVLSRHGADKVVLATGEGLDARAMFASHGSALVAVSERFPPALMLFPDDLAGHDIAPRVAARLGAAFASRPLIEIDEEGALSLTRVAYRGKFKRRLEVDDLERSVVATVACDDDAAPAAEIGTDEAEAIVVTAPDPALPVPAPLPESEAPGPAAGALKVAVMIRRSADNPREPDPIVTLGRGDRAALATALKLREAGAEVEITAVAVGPDAENGTLELASRLGISRLVRLWHPALDGADYHALSRALAGVARTLGADLVLCGEQSDDEALAAMAPAIAEHLGITHVSGAEDVARVAGGLSFSRRGVPARLVGSPPLVLGMAAGLELAEPDPLSVPGTVEVWELARIGVAPEEVRHRRRFLGKIVPV